MARIGCVIHTNLRSNIFTPEDWARLGTLGELVATDSAEPISVEDACALLQGCQVGIGSWGTPHPCAELMGACPDLKLWEHVAGTVKHMFGPHLDGTDLMIATCKPANGDNVAEMTLAEIILGARQALPNMGENRRGACHRPAASRVMFETTVGIVGASEVGMRVIRLLQPFPSRVLLYDPYCTPEEASDLGAELVADLTELCRRSDVVSLHTPAIPACEKIIGAEQLQAMPDHCTFINTARGLCVDQAALIAELEKGRLFAMLDVTLPEPAADDSPLRRLPNCVITSHIAGIQAKNLGHQAVNDVEAFLAGGRPLRVEVAENLNRMA